MQCRLCNSRNTQIFIDLGEAPPSNSFILPEDLEKPEAKYPLRVHVCAECFLAQAEEHAKHAEIFNAEYAYFSSFSTSWLRHSEAYVELITEKLALNSESFVVEIASNDGYLLQYFLHKQITCLGIEPTLGTAEVARKKGIETITEFFGENLAQRIVNEKDRADLIIGNNVLAHTPHLHDFVEGVRILLRHDGTATFEFPHLKNLILYNQFDTVYHEHFSYFSLLSVSKLLDMNNLHIVDVEELTTHGGSLRIYVRHKHIGFVSPKVFKVLESEKRINLNNLSGYTDFQTKIETVKRNFRQFLETAKSEGKKIAAYGAAAKGNTLLNFAEIDSQFIDYVVDKSPHKQGKYLPGSKIPIVSEEKFEEIMPDYVLILPWNLKDEITEQLIYLRDTGVKFVIAIPELSIF